jgi:hypothetical protein
MFVQRVQFNVIGDFAERVPRKQARVRVRHCQKLAQNIRLRLRRRHDHGQ